MNAIDKHYLSLQFKLKIHSKNGSEFQSFFENIMGEAFGDFRKIPSGGGDGGNDGWIPSLGRYYQVYAPNVPATKDSEASKKLKEDFKKLLKNWGSVSGIKEYFFVYNDKYFGAKEPEKALAELRSNYPEIKFDLFLAVNLEDIFFSLDESKILNLGFNIEKRLAISNGLEYLKKVEWELDREHVKYALKSLTDIENIILKLSNDDLILEYKILECRCLQKLERVDEAIEKYKNLSKMYPDDSRPFLFLSEIYLSLDDIDKNRELLEKAKNIDPEFWLLKLNELIRRNFLNEDIDISRIDEDSFPDNRREKSTYYRVYSSILLKHGDIARAESFIEKAIYHNPVRLQNFTIKFALSLNRILSCKESSDIYCDSEKLLQEMDEVEGSFSDGWDIGPRNKAVFNAIRLDIYRLLENIQDFERISQETYELLLNCYLDKQVQEILSSFLSVVSLAECDLDRLVTYLTRSKCKLLEILSTALVLQFNFHNNLLTVGKNFFYVKGVQDYYKLIVDIVEKNTVKVLESIKGKVDLAIVIASSLKSFPELRKEIIENLPNDSKSQKDKLMLILNYDEEDYDESFEILKKLDLENLNYL